MCQILAGLLEVDGHDGRVAGTEALGGQAHLPGFNPLAAALLCGLREPVVA